jgi:hypothetical protein
MLGRSEIATRVQQQAFDYLDAPVITIAGKDVPMPYAANLEKLALPNVARSSTPSKPYLHGVREDCQMPINITMPALSPTWRRATSPNGWSRKVTRLAPAM